MKTLDLKSIVLAAICLFCSCFPLLAQEIDLYLGHTDSLYSETLQEYRPIVVRLPKDNATSGKQYTTLYLLDGNDAGMLHLISAAAKLNLLNDLIIVGIVNTDRERDMMPLSAESYPVVVPGAENFLTFIGDELIPYIEKNYPSNGRRVLRGQSLSGLFTMYTLLSTPQLFNGYIGSSAGWYGDMDTFFSGLADKAFEQRERFNSKVIFMAHSLTDPLDPHQELNNHKMDFFEKLDGFFSGKVNYKYVTYDAYGHLPSAALHDGLRYLAESSDLFKPVLAGNE